MHCSLTVVLPSQAEQMSNYLARPYSYILHIEVEVHQLAQLDIQFIQEAVASSVVQLSAFIDPKTVVNVLTI